MKDQSMSTNTKYTACFVLLVYLPMLLLFSTVVVLPLYAYFLLLLGLISTRDLINAYFSTDRTSFLARVMNNDSHPRPARILSEKMNWLLIGIFIVNLAAVKCILPYVIFAALFAGLYTYFRARDLSLAVEATAVAALIVCVCGMFVN